MKNFEEILEKIAKENGTTPENVRREIQRAIDEAYGHHNADAQPLWNKMAPSGNKPTPEEFVMQLAMMLHNGYGILQ